MSNFKDMFLYPSEPIYHLNLPDPPDFTANFVYRFYEANERTGRNKEWEIGLYGTNFSNSRKYQIYGAPRYVDIKFSDTLFDSDPEDLRSYIITTYSSEVVIGQNAFSEASIQKMGLVRRDPSTTKLNQTIVNSVDNSVNSSYENFLSISSNIESDFNVSYLADIFKLSSNVPEIEETTGAPKQISYNSIIDKGLCININDDFIYDAIRTSINETNAYYEEQNSNLASSNTKQQLARLLNDAEFFDPAEGFPSNIVPIESDSEDIAVLKEFGMKTGEFYGVGVLLFKYLVSGQTRELVETLLLTTTEYRDFKIAYGDEYLYSAHSLYATITSDFSSSGITQGEESMYFFYSNDSRQLRVVCQEKRAPNPPTGISFRKLGNSIMAIDWVPVQNISNSDGFSSAERIPANDVSGFQVFSRSDVTQPFELIKWYSIQGASLPVERLPENLGFRDIVLTRQAKVELPRDETKIYSIVAMDYHGNSSGYSAQYKVEYISNSNDFNIELISKSGAPKGYPNMYLGQGKLFKDSIKSSDFGNVDIVYNPDIDGLITPNATVPKYVLQLIDVMSIESQEIDIIIKQT